MRKKIRDKIALAAVLLALTTPCACAYGQSDGFFNSWQSYRNVDDFSGDINNQSFGDDGNEITNQTFGEAPLGGGMAILVASAAGYALLKRRRDSKQTEFTNDQI